MTAPPAPERIRPRALALGLGLGLGLCLAVPWTAARLGNPPLGGGHFPLAPFFVAAWLYVLSALGARRTGRAPLSGAEILAAWLLMTLCTGVAYGGLARTFFIAVSAPDFFARDALSWTAALRPLLPDSWLPADPGAAAVLYDGLPGGRTMGWAEVAARVPWAVWLPPLASWAVFIGLSWLVMASAARLFGPQWVRGERLNFPLLRVPQLLGEALDAGRFGALAANPYLLAGLAVPVLLHGLNGLHFHFPSVPELPTLLLAGPYFPKTGLFSGFHKLRLAVIPACIGFAFLTPRQISFSFWFFFLLGGLSYGLLASLGLHLPQSALGTVLGPEYYRPEQAQAIGAYAVFALFLIWLARGHLGASLRAALPGAARGAGVSPWPARLLALGLAGLVLWCLRAGLPPLAAVLVPGAFVLVMLVVSRLVCQGGLAHFTLTVTPLDGLTGLFGSGMLGRAGLVAAAAMQKLLFMDLAESAMPTLVHGEKIREGGARRGLPGWLPGLVLALAGAVSLGFMLLMCYRYGLRDLHPDWAASSTRAVFDAAARLLDAPLEPSGAATGFALAGAAVMLGLVAAFSRAPWWPLHPIGYLTAYSQSMRILWFCFFLGWLANHLCLHYGGTALFKRLRFFFAGLVLGDFLMGGLFAAVGLFTGRGYPVFPF